MKAQSIFAAWVAGVAMTSAFDALIGLRSTSMPPWWHWMMLAVSVLLLYGALRDFHSLLKNNEKRQ